MLNNAASVGCSISQAVLLPASHDRQSGVRERGDRHGRRVPTPEAAYTLILGAEAAQKLTQGAGSTTDAVTAEHG